MNRKYIKRQLNLRKIGISMSDDVQICYDEICKYIGDENLLDKVIFEDYKEDCIVYLKDDTIIIEYLSSIGYILVDSIFWLKLHDKYKLPHASISALIGVILGHILNIDTTSAHQTEKLDYRIRKIMK